MTVVRTIWAVSTAILTIAIAGAASVSAGPAVTAKIDAPDPLTVTVHSRRWARDDWDDDNFEYRPAREVERRHYARDFDDDDYDDGYEEVVVYERRVYRRRAVVVDAPFTHVYSGRRGHHIVAPFVDVWLPR